MTQHLEPCPKCGKEVPYTTALDDGEDVRWAEWSCPCGLYYHAESRIVNERGVHDAEAELAELHAAWNTRAAATPEQFALAVHNGEAWARVRTCRKLPSGAGDDWRCSECGAWNIAGSFYDRHDHIADTKFCPNCGAKIEEMAE